jgi:hypothetical protein
MSESLLTVSSVRSQLSSAHLIPTIKATFEFLHHLTTLDGQDPSVDIPQLARTFLRHIPIPSFIDLQSPDITREPSATSRYVEEPLNQEESAPMSEQDKLEDTREAEVDELLMHMSLAEDGQVSTSVDQAHTIRMHILESLRLSGKPLHPRSSRIFNVGRPA